MKKEKNTTKNIKLFWDAQAKEFKRSQLATAPDTYYRDLEVRSILERLPKGRISVLDVGCGNGYSTIEFSAAMPRATFVGVDYSEPMIAYANESLRAQKELSARVSFTTGNVLSLSSTPALKGKKFDYLVSERCLINLRDWKEQQQALLEMKKMLTKGGRILLVENTQEGLARLNMLRTQFDLPAIAVRWHNYYMPEKKLLAFAQKRFILESVENIGNLYYILSRVVYAALAKMEGKEPEYLHPINKIASQLPSLGTHHWSPNFMFVLKNR